MKTRLFDYHLPERLIARYPAKERSQSRLLCVKRACETIQHDHFYNIERYLDPGDVLVLNDSRVIPARLLGRRSPGGGKAEVLLIQEREPLVWEAMVRPGKKIKPGDKIVFQKNVLEGEILHYQQPGQRIIRFSCRGEWWETLQNIGHTPLPPYILKARRDDLHTDFSHLSPEEPGDQERYQTVYAHTRGSVAAPTAGLHFSMELLERLRRFGVEIVYITLHVGPGTFVPVTSENVEDHIMHKERYFIPEETAERINLARKEKRRVIAAGTTVVRTLESSSNKEGLVKAETKETQIMIVPGYRFQCCDVILTNFHLPRSTLLTLVCAFAGNSLIMKCYHEAMEKGYRFYSYGDAMLII
ncbi:tRNA preQ1(34) S-adenosylmethionine ribosyltransferase-isomerase QueA [Candidatus Sumerlaeota bacterium]|nr:tRNA preQ1(34) S-adenosylmethionine ribosyltransferase-isomerase QueA [Candidatus Sumerlaeota bacterium]